MTDPAYGHGTFFGTRVNTLTGAVVDQAQIFADVANPEFQDNAYEAIHRFLDAGVGA